MLRKKPVAPEVETSETAASVAAEPGRRAAPEDPQTIIDHMLLVRGDLITEGDMKIAGQVEGNVNARSLTVAPSGVVNGDVTAEELVIAGKVVGRVTGQKVRLAATAQVEAEIHHHVIAIDSGACFNGTVKQRAAEAAALVAGVAEKAAAEGEGADAEDDAKTEPSSYLVAAE